MSLPIDSPANLRRDTLPSTASQRSSPSPVMIAVAARRSFCAGTKNAYANERLVAGLDMLAK
jgi:hypothetical protein